MIKPFRITRSLVTKIDRLLNHGLTQGKGVQKPGEMCIEAAICFALGLPHSDNPPCVSPAVRAVKIVLNDSDWSSNMARAAGMKRIAIAQLGTADVINDVEFAKKLAELTIRKMLPRTLRRVAALPAVKDHGANLETAAIRCETNGNGDAASYAARAARAASAASYAGSYVGSTRDAELTFFADLVLEVLIACKAPGAKWVKYVTPIKEAA